MLYDLNDFLDDVEFRADICLVGAGPAGLTIARELAGTRAKVLLVESGGAEPEAATAALSAGVAESLPNQGLTAGRARALGGASRLWAGQCIPMDHLDFQKRTWVPYSGWPLDLNELAPYYQRAERRLALPTVSYDDRIWAEFGIKAPDFRQFHLEPRFTVYCSETNYFELHRDTLTSAKNIDILLHGNVVAIVPNSAVSAIDHLVIRGLGGRVGRVFARFCVLCAGAVENARLLLLSNQVTPAGLGNGRDLVGRFFQDHPTALTASLAASFPPRLQELFSLLYAKRARYFPKLAVSAELQRRMGILNAVTHPTYTYIDDLPIECLRRVAAAVRTRWLAPIAVQDLIAIAPHFPTLMHSSIRWLVTGRTPRFPARAIHLQTFIEQAPSPENRVCLAPERDPLGLNKAVVNWRLDALDRRTFEVTTRTATQALQALGLGEWTTAEWLHDDELIGAGRVTDTYHHAGTTRMAHTPSGGVVDPSCQVHGVFGLYVAGASVFPTSGFANPTLTIAALAIRLADHLRLKLSV